MVNLEDMSLEELWELFPIILEKHKVEYKGWFEEEKANLTNILRDYTICRISHIGSTAVEGLLAKPTVDILMEFPTQYEMKPILTLLRSQGWLKMTQNDELKTLDLNKGYMPEGFAKRVFHLHIKPEGDWGELYFRDYLRKYPDVAREYETLKLGLKEQFEHDRDAYTNGKTEFVSKYTQKARKEFARRYQVEEKW